MDTNAPGEEHWIPIIAGDVDPPDWMNAEELRALCQASRRGASSPSRRPCSRSSRATPSPATTSIPSARTRSSASAYYKQMIAGKSRTWINIYILNRYATLIAGKAVYEKEWNDNHPHRPGAAVADRRHPAHRRPRLRPHAGRRLQAEGRTARCASSTSSCLSGVCTRDLRACRSSASSSACAGRTAVSTSTATRPATISRRPRDDAPSPDPAGQRRSCEGCSDQRSARPHRDHRRADDAR